MNEFLTAKEATEFLVMSKTKVIRLIKSGELEGEKNEKGRWIVSMKSIRHFLKDDEAEESKGTPEITVPEEAAVSEEAKPSRFIMNDYVPGS